MAVEGDDHLNTELYNLCAAYRDSKEMGMDSHELLLMQNQYQQILDGIENSMFEQKVGSNTANSTRFPCTGPKHFRSFFGSRFLRSRADTLILLLQDSALYNEMQWIREVPSARTPLVMIVHRVIDPCCLNSGYCGLSNG